MSSKVSGGINRGSGNKQMTVTFKGQLGLAAWDAFIEEVTQVAHNHSVKVFEFPKPPTPKMKKR